jgi:hypothetical protein
MLDAMDEPTPVAPSRKRPHTAVDASSDHEDDDEQLPANVFSLTSRSVVEMLQRLGESKRLRAEQIADTINSVNVGIYFNVKHRLLIPPQDPPSVQGAKMILCLHALHNRLDAFQTGKPPFAVSDDTEVSSMIVFCLICAHPSADEHLLLCCRDSPLHQIERLQRLRCQEHSLGVFLFC